MPSEAQPLTHARIAKFYVPLALSWIFMALESPVCIGVISRLAYPELNTAAFNILMGIALFIESPVIDLLSTSTTLSKNHRDFATLSRFVWMLMIGTAIVHAVVIFTPLYFGVTRHLMGVPEEVALKARGGLAMMIPWAASIAWRRYRQGLLIRFHQTRMVGFGTAVRVTTVTTVSLLLCFFTRLPGVNVVGTALVCAVMAEALFAQWASRDVVRRHLSKRVHAAQGPLDIPTSPSPVGSLEQAPDREPGGLTMRQLLTFHGPLTLTTMVTLVGGPTVSAFLSRAPDPVLALASWQVAFSLLWLFRTITFALPEVVITLYRDEQTARKLREFCVRVGLATSGLAILIALLRLDVWFFRNVFDRTVETSEMAHLAFAAAAPLAFINSMQSYVRGMLTAHHLNVARFTAVLVGIITMLLALWGGLYTPWRGVLSGSLAMNLSLIAELAVLVFSWRRGKVGAVTVRA